MKILVTGGAGFIGSFLVDKLVEQGYKVRIFDNFDSQVHSDKTPKYLNKNAEFIKGDVTNKNEFREALKDIDVVFHLASAVGVGQSMYKIAHYANVNIIGTANLLDLIVNSKINVKKIIVAASMSSYSEGMYNCEKCGNIRPNLRTEEQMKNKKWELECNCGNILKPIPIKESAVQNCNSIYAMTKKVQEDMVLKIGETYKIPAVALRYFNVYGPRQSLSNPYTGVAAIFMSRIKNNNQPVIYEDGLQSRDFISVHDITRANILAMEKDEADYESFNVGSGNPLTIKDVAKKLAKAYGKNIDPLITEKYRKGDVRHCFSDISKIKSKLGFCPKVDFTDGIKELIKWSKEEDSVDMFDKATKEMEDKGLV